MTAVTAVTHTAANVEQDAPVEQVDLSRLLLHLVVPPLDLHLVLLDRVGLLLELLVEKSEGLQQPCVVGLRVQNVDLQGETYFYIYSNVCF